MLDRAVQRLKTQLDQSNPNVTRGGRRGCRGDEMRMRTGKWVRGSRLSSTAGAGARDEMWMITGRLDLISILGVDDVVPKTREDDLKTFNHRLELSLVDLIVFFDPVQKSSKPTSKWTRHHTPPAIPIGRRTDSLPGCWHHLFSFTSRTSLFVAISLVIMSCFFTFSRPSLMFDEFLVRASGHFPDRVIDLFGGRRCSKPVGNMM